LVIIVPMFPSCADVMHAILDDNIPSLHLSVFKVFMRAPGFDTMVSAGGPANAQGANGAHPAAYRGTISPGLRKNRIFRDKNDIFLSALRHGGTFKNRAQLPIERGEIVHASGG
jgi:hypothetical protein